MDKEKEIRLVQIAKDIYFDENEEIDDETILYGLKEGLLDCAKRAEKKGYRKADEVRKETAKEIWNKLYQKADNTCNNRLNLNKQDIRFFAAQDGVEVDDNGGTKG